MLVAQFLETTRAPIVWEAEAEMHQYSADIADDFEITLIQIARRLQARPLDLAKCWFSESGIYAKAHNPGGNASGIFQIMPATLAGLGYAGHWQDFLALSATEQLYWAERYYAAHAGRLDSAAACYLATFLPALLAHSREPLFVLCAKNGPFGYAYDGNHNAFDPEGKGYITVQDLADRMDRAAIGNRWKEIEGRIMAAEDLVDTVPDAVPNLGTISGQQCALNSLGYECEVDGVWGPQSGGACRSFQYDHGLKADGVFGPVTRAEVTSALVCRPS